MTALRLPPYAKAIVGFIAAAAAFLVPVVDDGLLASEILGALVAGLAGGGLVYGVPNGVKPGTGRHRAGDTRGGGLS